MKSNLRTFHKCLASPIATKLTTEEMTIVANTNLGSFLINEGKITNASITNKPVTKPANGVFAPVLLATADLENEPATG